MLSIDRYLQRSIAILGAVALLRAQTPAPKAAVPVAPSAKPAPAAAPKPTAAVPAKPVTPPKAPAAATPKLDPLVASVLELKKAGAGEELIVKGILKEKRSVPLGMAEIKLLKAAGLSDRVVGLLMDPTEASPPTVAATPAAAPASASASAAPAPAPAATTTPVATQKRRLAVEEFDYSTVRTYVQAIFNTPVDIGKGIRSLLTVRVQQGGKISVLERAKVNTIMAEQDFGASNRVKKGTNARVGRILGSDAILMGDIVAFGRDDKGKQVNVGAFGGRVPVVGGMLGGLRIGNKEEKAVVVINYRIVDSETSEVIDTGEARGESSRKSKGFGGLLAGGGAAVGGSMDMTSSNFAETIIGEAVIAACDKLGAIMNEKIPKLPPKDLDVEGRVADVSGSQLTLTVGTNDGVVVGDMFEVFKVLGEVRDPVTKEILDLNTEKSGEMRITTVREKIAVGSYSGSAVAAGAVARKKK